MPPSDFCGRAGRCGTQISPFLNSGLPLSMSLESASTVAVTAPVASDWASSSETSMPAIGLRPAAARVLGSEEAPIETPREVLCALTLSSLRDFAPRGPRIGSDARSGLRPAADFCAFSSATFSACLRASTSIFLRCLPAFEASSRWLSTVEASASASNCFTQSETEPESGAPSNGACGASSNAFEGAEDLGDLAMAGIWRRAAAKGRVCGGKSEQKRNGERWLLPAWWQEGEGRQCLKTLSRCQPR